MTEKQVRSAVELACLLMNGEPLSSGFGGYFISSPMTHRDDGSLDVVVSTPGALAGDEKRPLFKAFVVAACGMLGFTATPQWEHESMVTFWVKENG